MPSALDEALTELDGAETGFVLGALLAGAVDEPSFAAVLPAPSRERCAQALAAIAALPRKERVRLTGQLARSTRSVSPSGIDAVHPDHLSAALDQESEPLIRKVASGLGHDTPTTVRVAITTWLAAQNADAEPFLGDPLPTGDGDPELLSDVQQSVFAGLAEVPPAWQGVAPVRWSRQLTLLDPVALLTVITEGSSGTDGEPTAEPAATAPPETLRLRARALGARLAREDAGSLGAADQTLAVAQRLPRTLAEALLEGAHGTP